MNVLKPPVLTIGPPIAKPRNRKILPHLAKPQQVSGPRSSRSHTLPASPQKGFLNPSDSFSLADYMKDNPSKGKAANEILTLPFKKRITSRQSSVSAIEQMRHSVNLGDVSKSIEQSPVLNINKNRVGLRKARYSTDDELNAGSPLAFSESMNEDATDKEEESQVVVIIIKSNWGSPDFLRISSISILDEKYKAVPIIRSTTSPDYGIDTSCLFNGHLIKKEFDELFEIPWYPDHEPIRIAIEVSADIIIHGVRIFNSEISLDSSVKDVSILFDDVNNLNGEIPKNFGIDFKFIQQRHQDSIESSRLVESYFAEHREKSFKDKYGMYPFFSTKTLSFELKKSWTDENFIGLNGFQIYDQNNKLLQIDDVDDIILHHCGSSNDPSLLMKKKLQTSKPEQQFLTKTLPGNPPKIEIIFKKNHFLSRIVVWNYNSAADPVEYGVKYIKICSDENIIWCGKLNKSIGNEISADKKIKTVWLTDSIEIKNQEILEKKD